MMIHLTLKNYNLLNLVELDKLKEFRKLIRKNNDWVMKFHAIHESIMFERQNYLLYLIKTNTELNLNFEHDTPHIILAIHVAEYSFQILLKYDINLFETDYNNNKRRIIFPYVLLYSFNEDYDNDRSNERFNKRLRKRFIDYLQTLI